MSLCEAEKFFVLHGVAADYRVDGRSRREYRPIEVETGVVSHAFGSSRIRLANTDVLVAVKIEVDVPHFEKPDEGKIEFFVDCSANATPDFEGRGGGDLAEEISNSLTAAYKSKSALDLSQLCILKGRKCWKLFLDILLLEVGGNIYDAVSIAVKTALSDTLVPHVRSVTVDGNNIDMDVCDELYDCERLNVAGAPIMVTVCRIGDHCVIDPNSAEEECSVGALVVAVANEKFTTVLQTGAGSLHPSTLTEALKLGREVAKEVDETLLETLSEIDPNEETAGFLK